MLLKARDISASSSLPFTGSSIKPASRSETKLFILRLILRMGLEILKYRIRKIAATMIMLSRIVKIEITKKRFWILLTISEMFCSAPTTAVLLGLSNSLV